MFKKRSGYLPLTEQAKTENSASLKIITKTKVYKPR
jgi:hypothetical protein